jgi:hypothetical protein
MLKDKTIADVLKHAGRSRFNPHYSLFSYQDGEWSLLLMSTDASAVADRYKDYAISGEHGDCLEIRCDGVRVSLAEV